MNALIHLQLGLHNGSLERLLRVIRHRGFHISNMNVALTPDGQCYDVTLRIESQRQLLLLTRQLSKLTDVMQLDVLSQGSHKIATNEELGGDYVRTA